MLLSYIIPTRDRPERLRATLDALAHLDPHDAEVIIVDNDSEQRALLPASIGDMPVRTILLHENMGAAARNLASASARGEWLVMLDDDSHPLDVSFVRAIAEQPAEVWAVMADIFLARSTSGGCRARESGGLPEVFVGCGVAIRREIFESLGGYDPTFGYYAEEYDFSARLIRSGGLVAFEPEFRVLHHKESRGRDMGLILGRLVRNNGWVMRRFAPASERRERLRETLRRYHSIAQREEALRGYDAGLRELRRTIRTQARTPLTTGQWERFTGLAHARDAIQAALAERAFRTAAVVEEGKNCWAVVRALSEAGVRLCADRDDAEVLVIGTLSPGPLLDAVDRAGNPMHGQRVIVPWLGARRPALV